MDDVARAGRLEAIPVAFRAKVLELVALIPEGEVATYGQIALLAGHPRAARQVGMVLYSLSDRDSKEIPWQRVINAKGGISTYKVGTGELQRALLEAESIIFREDGTCDLKQYQTNVISPQEES